MTVDFTKAKKILVVHGVQLGTDGDLVQDKEVAANIESQLSGHEIDHSTEMFNYESINDASQMLVRRALAALTGNAVKGLIVDSIVDIVGDVTSALSKGDTYEDIKSKLRQTILDTYSTKEPLFIVSHSLGTVYAFDVLNELMKEPEFYQYDKPETNPVQGLITLGSPLSLGLFNRDWRKMHNLMPKGKLPDVNTRLFPWVNYADSTDPVVSGDLLGGPWNQRKIKKKFIKKFRQQSTNLGWHVETRRVVSKKAHLGAHFGYWSDPAVGNGIVQMLHRGITEDSV